VPGRGGEEFHQLELARGQVGGAPVDEHVAAVVVDHQPLRQRMHLAEAALRRGRVLRDAAHVRADTRAQLGHFVRL
jgi:hypothetical protein